MKFPNNFVWGAASAAYQIEGASFEDGKGLSIWDVHTNDTHPDPITGISNIKNNDNGNIACDHYHRYREDVALMKKIGIKAYRFSLSWTRIIPDGQGAVNQKGIDFYNNLIDELLAAGIEPYITLFHWDFPQKLQEIGGWSHPDMPRIFADYVQVAVEAFSDRVKYWMTLNEPQCHIIVGHVDGKCAPKLRVSPKEAFYLIHSILKAHGLGVQRIRQYAKQNVQVGIAPNPSAFYPYSDNPDDQLAAQEKAFTADSRNLWATTWWLDPLLLGHYPEDGIEAYGSDFPQEINNPEDLAIINQSLDFLGCNFYTGACVRADNKGMPVIVDPKIGYDRTAFKWEVTPRILQYMPIFLYNRYHLPILITENGLSLSDWVSLDGKVHDPNRIDYMQRYLRELKKAIDRGVPVLGYLTWSIMDNFEWNDGYGERFGLIHVDYGTQKRTIKDSGYWYNKIIESNGKSL
ncbi:GH1 family beta-glucosidase [Spirochaeta cellobiosiphila]|uniref:GH1 family beta-glucosidase n=1 Tax=Spirochaeta cellobiosiphila TaxID=504483 RepID=UPI0003FD6AC1|nr:GH1 family beta-glucosidase [Spirochaeta cellobiosiphila]